VKLTRREALAGAAAGALSAAGVYELVDRLTGGSPPRAAAGELPPEQHVLDGVRAVKDRDLEVLVPPLHHEVLTAKVKVGRTDLRDAQRALENALASLDERYAPTPAGLGVTVAWGLPYFERVVPGAWRTHAPHDRRADRLALPPSRRFPSDPLSTTLEENDVAILLRSDSLEHIADASRRLHDVDVLEWTSIRRGFAGGGFEGARSLPKRMALAAGVPGADLIPETAELFLGFTSTLRRNLGPRRIVNFETLGFVDLGPRGYFREGTHMHLSHIREDLEAWYLNFDFQQRVDTTFAPKTRAPHGAQTVAVRDLPPSPGQISRDFHESNTIGHSSSIQTTSRVAKDHIAEDGTVYRAGTAIPQRADFNTLDNPFFWSASPQADAMSHEPAAGVHFVVFNPSGDDFERNRLAMDGVLPDGTKLPFFPRQRGQGFNDVLETTHRQNFLVPPRRRRSFPLAELRA
jgi:hypothetical protein